MNEPDRERFHAFAEQVAAALAEERPFAAALVAAAKENDVAGAVAFATGNLLLQFVFQNALPLQQPAMVVERLAEAVEKAQRELQLNDRTTINLPFLSADASGPKHMSVDLGHADMLELASRTPDPNTPPPPPSGHPVHPEPTPKKKRFWLF